MLLAASHPDRVNNLVLYGTFARLVEAADYPSSVTAQDIEKLIEVSGAGWGEGIGLGAWAPSRRGDDDLRRWWARLQRLSASPGMVRNIFALYPKVDIREVLPAIQAPTLVLNRRNDLMVSLELARYLADNIPGAKLVELDGTDHLFFTGDADALLDEVEEFLTGSRPAPLVQRVLATVLFTDVVGSTERGGRAGRRPMEAAPALARRPGAPSAGALPGPRGEHHGRRVPCHLRRPPPGRSAARRRSGTRSAAWGSKSAPACTPARSR